MVSTLTGVKSSEEEKDGQVAPGAGKHWHIFEIIAKL